MQPASIATRVIYLGSSILSAVMIFWPAAEQTPLKLVWSVAGVACGVLVFRRMRRAGLLGLTPSQLTQRMRANGSPPSDAFETLATAMLIVAVLAIMLR